MRNVQKLKKSIVRIRFQYQKWEKEAIGRGWGAPVEKRGPTAHVMVAAAGMGDAGH